MLLRIYKLLIFIQCILSWFPVPSNAVTDFIYRVTEPAMRPVRMLTERLMGGRSMPVDFSPIILFLIIQMVIEPLIRILF